ncbi:hypothetical protein EGR_10641 [Echinococcus granulosus]|uniref:Uncharacterized protein n=1 Tax=Echinococcus granulosus TaxID=6210 RepID=W6U085_ECHGR|nr:hypothetical protein EGR_10641 [Echinococcus granulosus]EUB54505.1 hypothetical protein EGR_10641 [Echinococcus granulosus]
MYISPSEYPREVSDRSRNREVIEGPARSCG